jgi:hypothetical protein
MFTRPLPGGFATPRSVPQVGGAPRPERGEAFRGWGKLLPEGNPPKKGRRLTGHRQTEAASPAGEAASVTIAPALVPPRGFEPRFWP